MCNNNNNKNSNNNNNNNNDNNNMPYVRIYEAEVTMWPFTLGS